MGESRDETWKRQESFLFPLQYLLAVILFMIFMIVLTFKVFNMSLYKWGGFSNTKEFVGLNNFKILFQDPTFYRSFQNTIVSTHCYCDYSDYGLALIYAYKLSRRKLKVLIFQSCFLISPIFYP